MNLCATLILTFVNGFLAPDTGPARQSYEVWKERQLVHASPHSYAQVLARPAKGVRLQVLERNERWGRVRVPESAVEGWTLLDSPPAGAGDRMEQFAGAAARASLAMAVKAFDDLARSLAELMPEKEGEFVAIRDSYLEPQEIGDFVAAGGLKLPAER